MIPISIDVTDKENCYTKTIKVFGYAVYQVTVKSDDDQASRTVGFNAAPDMSRYIDDD